MSASRTRILGSELVVGDEVYVDTNTTSVVTFVSDRPNNVMRVNGRRYKAVEYVTADGWTHTMFADDPVEVSR